MKFDVLHFALLVCVILIAVYAFGSFREEYNPNVPLKSFEPELKNARKWINSQINKPVSYPPVTWIT